MSSPAAATADLSAPVHLEASGLRRFQRPGGSRWCVFTSAGDHSNVVSWLPPEGTRRSWDLVVAFYGESEDEFRKLAAVADIAFAIKGSKFQNLKTFHLANPDFLQQYDFVFVADDDLIWLTENGIQQMFEFAARHEFWVCQPAFSSIGRISFQVTRWAGLHSSYRTTNYVEMTCPMFRSHALLLFLDIYDGKLVGWGTDWWFCNVLQSHRYPKFAISDEIVVINPHSHQRRGGRREITRLATDTQRKAEWRQVMARYKLDEFRPRTFRLILRNLFYYLPKGSFSPGIGIKMRE